MHTGLSVEGPAFAGRQEAIINRQVQQSCNFCDAMRPTAAIHEKHARSVRRSTAP